MAERTAEQIYSFIDNFHDINDVEPKPDDVVTYYCKHKDGEGFVENIAWKNGEIEKFICRKWILQNELDALFKAAEQSAQPTGGTVCQNELFPNE